MRFIIIHYKTHLICFLFDNHRKLISHNQSLTSRTKSKNNFKMFHEKLIFFFTIYVDILGLRM